MAKYYGGINGPIIGRVGNVVGYMLYGEPVLRAVPKKKRKKKRNAPKLPHRAGFRDAHKWLAPLLDFLRVGFAGYSKSHAYNGAKSYNLQYGVDIIDDVKVMNPEKVRVSYGDLALPSNIAATITSDNRLQFSWEPGDRATVNEFDQAMLLAYDDTTGKAEMKITGQFRYVGADLLNLSDFKSGQQCHVYIAFVAADRSEQSNSQYLGVISIP